VIDNNITNINTPEKLGIAIKRLRKISGLSQDQLAKKIKIRQPTLSEVENGRGTIESLFKIVQGLQLNLCLSVKSNMIEEKISIERERNAQKALEYLKSLERIKN
jgi:transcriptional regulator with XRE-family HTH domain